jgi:hypothetical protein
MLSLSLSLPICVYTMISMRLIKWHLHWRSLLTKMSAKATVFAHLKIKSLIFSLLLPLATLGDVTPIDPICVTLLKVTKANRSGIIMFVSV